MIWIYICFAFSKSLEGKQLRKERRDVSKPIGCCFSFRPTPSRSPWANRCRRILCVFITPPSTPSRTCSHGPKRELGKPQHWLKIPPWSLTVLHTEKGNMMKKHCIWKVIRLSDRLFYKRGAFVNLKPSELIVWESELMISVRLLRTLSHEDPVLGRDKGETFPTGNHPESQLCKYMNCSNDVCENVYKILYCTVIILCYYYSDDALPA